MVEIPHGYPSVILGGSAEVEQAMEAIIGALLRQIRMANTREKDFRFQGDGFSSHGEPPILKANSYTSPSVEVRHTHLLQGGYPRNPPIHDDMETGEDNVR